MTDQPLSQRAQLEAAWFNHTATEHRHSGQESCNECDRLWQKIVDHWHRPRPSTERNHP